MYLINLKGDNKKNAHCSGSYIHATIRVCFSFVPQKNLDDYVSKLENRSKVKTPMLQRWQIMGLFYIFSLSIIEIMLVWPLIYHFSCCHERD